MKKAEVELPDALYQRVEGLATQLHTTVPDLLRRGAEQIVRSHAAPQQKQNGNWHFPEGKHLGAFLAPVEDWRTLANEVID